MGYLVGFDRGRCQKCNEPVVERGRGLVAFLTTASAKLTANDCAVTADTMFDSGLKQDTKGLVTIRSDLASTLFPLLFVIWPGMKQLVQLSFYTINGKLS